MSKPATKPREGRPARERLRWTVEWAEREFALNRRTLANRLTQLSIDADDDGYYSTKKIAAAVFGDLDGQRLRKTSAEAEQIEKENRKSDGELVDLQEIIRQWLPKFTEWVRLIESAPIPEDLRIQLRTQLEEVLRK